MGNARAAVIQFAARTEFPRLAAGELVYMGLLRTRLDAILPVARIWGRSILLAPELFSIMADTRLALGQISPEGYSCDTADGVGKVSQSALRRLARSVCADLEEIGGGAAMAIARQACCRQKEILMAAISRHAAEHGLERWRRGQARPNRRGGGIPGDGVRGHIGEVWERDIECLPGLCHGSAGGNG